MNLRSVSSPQPRLGHRDNDWLTTISELVRSHIASFRVPLLTSRPRFPSGAVPLKGMQMAKASRYIIWAHRDAHSVFGAANNPVVRNGSLLVFNDKARAHAECDRLNATWVIRTFVIRLGARQSIGAAKLPHDLSGVLRGREWDLLFGNKLPRRVDLVVPHRRLTKLLLLPSSVTLSISIQESHLDLPDQVGAFGSEVFVGQLEPACVL